MAYEIPEILAPVGSVSGISTHRMLVAIFQQLLQILKLTNLIVIHQALKPFMEGLLLKGLERFAAFAKERNSKIPQPWWSQEFDWFHFHWSVMITIDEGYIVTADVGKIMCWQRNKRVNIMASMKLKFGSYLSFLFFRYDYASWARCHHKPNVPTGHKENAPSKWLFWVQKNMVDVKCVQSFKDTINKQLNFFCNHLMFM